MTEGNYIVPVTPPFQTL